MVESSVLRGMAIAAFLGAVVVYARQVFGSVGQSTTPGTLLPPAFAPSAQGTHIREALALFDGELQTAAAAFNLDPDLLRAVVWRESRGNPNAVGDVTALGGPSYGLGQVLLATARGMGFSGDPAELLDPGVNLYYAARYLRSRLDEYGDIALAVASYNSGSPKYQGDQLINQAYVNEVLTNYAALQGALMLTA